MLTDDSVIPMNGTLVSADDSHINLNSVNSSSNLSNLVCFFADDWFKVFNVKNTSVCRRVWGRKPHGLCSHQSAAAVGPTQVDSDNDSAADAFFAARGHLQWLASCQSAGHRVPNHAGGEPTAGLPRVNNQPARPWVICPRAEQRRRGLCFNHYAFFEFCRVFVISLWHLYQNVWHAPNLMCKLLSAPMYFVFSKDFLIFNCYCNVIFKEPIKILIDGCVTLLLLKNLNFP